MKKLVTTILFVISSGALAATPEPKVTHASVYQGYATIAGVLTETPQEPVGIRVENGGLTYATVTDPGGKWSIVIRYRGTEYNVTAFDMRQQQNVDTVIQGNLKPE